MATEVWRWQGGTDQWDKTGGVSVGPNGSCTLAGWTQGNWSTADGHAGLSDWAAVNLDAEGNLQWKWQGGTSRQERLNAVATGSDGSVVMVGYKVDETVAFRFAAVKLDADGGLLWEWKDESGDIATAHAVATTEDGGAIWAGSTFGVWGEISAGSDGFTASKIDAEGKLVWAWQNGTSEAEELYAAVVGDDGTVVLAGYTYGNWTSPHGGYNDTDFAAVKLDGEGNELWRWQNGTTDNDELYGAANGHDGSVVLAGFTRGAWQGIHAGGFGDFCAVKLDADGGEVWRWQGGTAEDDIIKGVAPGDDGSTVLAGYTKGAWAGANDGSYDFAAVKLDANGNEVWRWQGGAIVAAADYGQAVAAGPNGSVILAGYTNGYWGEENNEYLYDFVVVRLDTNAAATPSPTAGLSPVVDALLSTPTPTGVRASRTPTAGLPPLATAVPSPPPLATLDTTASKSAGFFSPTTIGIVAAAAAVALVVAVVCLRKKRRAKQNISDDREDRHVPVHVPVIAVEPDEAGAADDAPPPARNPSAASGTRDVAQAVLQAANHLAHHSQFPGVAEAAMLVTGLVNLISNDQSRIAEAEARLKRCYLLVLMLQRAATVLGKIDTVEDSDSSKEMKRMLIGNVQDAIGDMIGLIKTYNSKRRLTQVVVSTFFYRRMEETDAVINLTFSDLMRWLHIDTALNQEESSRSLVNDQPQPTGLRARLKATKDEATVGRHLQRQDDEFQAESILSDRHLRRQRNLEQIEIPEDHVLISKDVLGKGGFGTVYIADYNGRNAAAKVIRIDHDDGQLSGGGDEDAVSGFDKGGTGAIRQRESLLLELQAMIRLRSPHTVNIYGAMTSRKDELILVMELLTGGDLYSLLRHSTEGIPEEQARRIIGDVCAGMVFLHSKNAIHGDLKSANVLLDGEGRAKIGDFGTSRWAKHSNSTGLATRKATQGNATHMMSFAWAAPEVLSAKGTSCASDVYSFGIVAWEVLSMEVPWAGEVPFDIYTRVVFKGDRPAIPADAPGDIAEILRACWTAASEERPTSKAILEMLNARAFCA